MFLQDFAQSLLWIAVIARPAFARNPWWIKQHHRIGSGRQESAAALQISLPALRAV